MKKYRLGFIGCGNMAQAVIKCLESETNRYMLKCNKIRFDTGVFDIDTDKAKGLGVNVFENAEALVSESDVVFLSIKPQQAAEAVTGIDFSDKLVVSIMAGVSLARLSELTGAKKLVRVMPNLNARVGAAFNAFCAVGLDEEETFLVRCVLGAFGETTEVAESDMNAVTGIAGSGPAFVFMFIKAFVEAGIKRGFDEKTAKKMALATIVGSAYTVEAEDKPIDELIGSVCSKGGTTIRGVEYLREQAMEDTVGEAIERAIRRAEEMERGE